MTEKLTYSIPETAKALGISRSSAYALAHEPGFPSSASAAGGWWCPSTR